jgi:hypothetical protein
MYVFLSLQSPKIYYYRKLFRGGHFGLIEVGKVPASIERSTLMQTTEAGGLPISVNQITEARTDARLCK